MQGLFPEQYRGNMNKIMGDIKFQSHYQAFDTVFLISALVSILILGINLKTTRN